MRGYSNVKSRSFQFGGGYKYPRPKENQADIGDSLYKMLCSWMNFKELLPSGSSNELDKIRSAFSGIFHSNQTQAGKRQRKAKYKRTPHIVKIDLDKIDRNLNLNSREKRRLKQILNQIRYRELSKQPNKKEVKRRNEKYIVSRKKNKAPVQERNVGRAKTTESMVRLKVRESQQRVECKNCTHCSEGQKPLVRRRSRRSLSGVTPSEERIFKTLMNLDRSCCGESFKNLFDTKSKRAFIKHRQNINIENLEFKYIQPTCLLQYTGLEKEFLPIDILGRSRSRVRLLESFSTSAFKSKSKQFQDCLLAKGFDINDRKSSDKVDKTFERTWSTCHQKKQSDFLAELDLTENKRDSEDNEALFFHEGESLTYRNDDADNSNNRRNNMNHISRLDKPRTRPSKYRKLKNFARKWLCLGDTEDDRHKTRSRQRKRKREGKNTKKRVGRHLSDARGNPTTKQELINRKKK